MDIKAFIYHKRSEKYCDCQDCFGINTQNNRIAISDGMTQSIFPQWWAKILVDAFLETGTIPYINILPSQQKWQEMVRNEITKQESEGKNPWLLKDMFAEKYGAGATLCGFKWDNKGWYCQCLGDSCLIKVNRNYSIEIITSQQGLFDNHPDYLDSFGKGRGTPMETKGDFDLKTLLLVTDPFSELFQQHQNDSNFINERLNEIHNLSDHESYVTLVEDWRNSYNLHNDDSTLVILSNLSSKEVKIIWEDYLEELCDKESKDLPQAVDKTAVERETDRAQFKNSTEKILNHYPPGRNKSKGKVYGWLKEQIAHIVETFCKQ